MSINLDTQTVGTPIPLPDLPFVVAPILPDQGPVASLATTAAPTGQPTTLDASASTVACGVISSYRWDFGDGSAPLTTSDAVTTHAYDAPGPHTVTVTETDSAGTSTTKAFTGQAMSRNGSPTAAATATVDIVQGPPAPAPTATPIAATPQLLRIAQRERFGRVVSMIDDGPRRAVKCVPANVIASAAMPGWGEVRRVRLDIQGVATVTVLMDRPR